MKRKTLFIITNSPPSEPGEEFLDSEIKILKIAFENIVIVHHSKEYSKPFRHTENGLLYFPYLPSRIEKIKSIRFVVSSVFWREVFDIIFHYKLAPTPRRIASALGAIAVGKKLVRFLNPEIDKIKNHKVYVYTYWCNFMAVGLAFLKQENPTVTCISRAHGYDVYFERNAIGYLPLRSFIFKTLDRIFFISKQGLRYSIKKTKKYPSMRVAYLGSHPIARRASKNHDTFHIVSCSRMIPLKRVELIIDILCILPVTTKIQWTHFGDGPLLAQIQNYAREMLSAKENFSYMFKGYISNKRLVDFYSKTSIDLFINVSESEGLPFSIIEAFSAGIPALATNVGGTSEIVESDKNGMLVSPELTAEELSHEIMRFISLDETKKRAYSENAFQKWSGLFRAKENFQEFIQDFI